MTSPDIWQGARRLLPSSLPADSAVLLLHGLGSSADDLIGLAPLLAPLLPHTVFISPNAPEPCDMAPFGYQWFSLQQWTPASKWQGVQKSSAVLNQMIDDVKAEFSLPASRIALVGFSQGAMMSLHVAPRLAEQLAGVVALSGALVGEEHLPDEIRSHPPVLLAHGQMDPVVPYGAMLAAQAALQRNNISVTAVSRPLMAHNVDDVTIGETATFLARHLAKG